MKILCWASYQIYKHMLIHIEWMALMKRKYRDGATPYRKITTEIWEDDAKGEKWIEQQFDLVVCYL